MPKNLVVFSDGTGNSSAKLFKTNVWRVYEAVDLTDPQDPAEPRQFAYYDDGVGTSSFKPLAVLGGAFGVGLARNILDLYVFLCRTWEPGDRIYAFGFSRGAFTIRVLIGLVMTEGLLCYRGGEADLQRLARDAYRAYRRKRFVTRNPVVRVGRWLRDTLIAAMNAALGRTPYARAERAGGPESAEPIRVEFVGVWDTVDAYGLPVDELTRAIDLFVWPLTMRDYNLNPRVRKACHALAIDDERNSFHPRLWNERPDPADPAIGVPGGNEATAQLDDERISQVWFAGMHSNVGGGYPDDSLSYVSLQWMMREANERGLRFEAGIWDDQASLADENGPIADSRRGLGGYYRYNPRRIERLVSTDKVVVPRTKVHESVLRRIAVGHDGYAPIALPPGFAVVKVDRTIVDGDAWLRALEPPRAIIAPVAPGDTFVGDGAPYAARREHVYNWVWRRRVAYFATLFVTLALLAMPLVLPGSDACRDRLCFLATPIAALQTVLPAFAAPWTRSFASHPDVFLALAAVLVAGLVRGGTLQEKIRDEMRRVWYAMGPMRRVASAPESPGPFGRAIEALRTSAPYRFAFRALTHGALPFAFLLGLAWAAVALGSQLAFSARESFGAICRADAAQAPRAGDAGFWFASAERCARAGVAVVAGDTYRIRVATPAAQRWLDQDIPAGPAGFECPLPTARALVFAGARPALRHPFSEWFRLTARIGTDGNDTYPLRATPSAALPADRCGAAPVAPAACPSGPYVPAAGDAVFESELVARSSGELFLYVNDTVDLPLAPDFYANNRGCSHVTVTRVSTSPPAR